MNSNDAWSDDARLILDKLDEVAAAISKLYPRNDAFLLHLVDVVWGEANEDTSVPSTDWAKQMIATARETFDEEANDGLIG